MSRLRYSLAVLALYLATLSVPSLAQPPLCFTNETCATGEYCACFRNRNEAIGDCDEMGGMCRLLARDEQGISPTKLERWKQRKADMKSRAGRDAGGLPR